MYKFLLNCPEPPAKKSGEKLEGQQKYEKKNRKCTFLPRWEKEFTWLKNMEKYNIKKIQKSDEKLRAELTHILLTRQHNA
jgi:hypothetical protein